MVPLLPSPDEDDDDGDDGSYPFNKEVVVDIEEGDDDDNGCTSWSFSADLDASGKNKKELVSFLFAELVIAEAVKKSPSVTQTR